MIRYLSILMLVTTTNVEAETPAAKTKSRTIPLEQIWAYEMPGTRNVRELEPKADLTLPSAEVARRSNIRKIMEVLRHRPKEGEQAGPAFVVEGTGKDALKHAEAVISNRKDTKQLYPPDTDLSVVFYSHMCGRYVHLISVEQSPEVITVEYRFVGHATFEMSEHFALIPIGKLPAGTYRVKVKQVEAVNDRGRPAKPIDEPQRFVSDSFSFTVRKE